MRRNLYPNIRSKRGTIQNLHPTTWTGFVYFDDTSTLKLKLFIGEGRTIFLHRQVGSLMAWSCTSIIILFYCCHWLLEALLFTSWNCID